MRRLVLAHGWNATSYQIVNPGIEHWLAPSRDAVVVRHGRVRVVAGAPVCALDRLPATVDAFERATAAAGERPCYFGAEGRLEGVLASSGGHAFLALGAQPVWRPSDFVAASRRAGRCARN